MPQKILHCLFTAEEEREMRANGFGLDTHGIHNVVIQFERGKRKVRTDVELLDGAEDRDQKSLPAPQREKTSQCRHCRKMFAPQGKWKHEKFCNQRKGNK